MFSQGCPSDLLADRQRCRSVTLTTRFCPATQVGQFGNRGSRSQSKLEDNGRSSKLFSEEAVQMGRDGEGWRGMERVGVELDQGVRAAVELKPWQEEKQWESDPARDFPKIAWRRFSSVNIHVIPPEFDSANVRQR